MEKIERKQNVEIYLRKIFDMKMKGHEMKKAVVDEAEFLRTLYFLKGSRVYFIDITTKKIEELDFTKGKEVIHICSNTSNEYLIVILKNGNIYAIDNNHNIKHIENLVVNSLLFDNKKSSEGVKSEYFKIFASTNLDKLVIANENFITIWYRSEKVSNNNKNILKKTIIEEINGTFYNISIENEKKLIYKSDFDKNKDNKCIESISAVFGNNYYHGSFGRIIYILLVKSEIKNSWKVYLIDYLFKYETSNQRNNSLALASASAPASDPSLEIRNIDKKIIYTYINYSDELCTNLGFNNPVPTSAAQCIIIKFNLSGNICVIVFNSVSIYHSQIMIYMTDTSKFSLYKMHQVFNKYKQFKNEEKFIPWIEDIDWICNDLFFIVILSNGYFFIMNLSFQLISFIDQSNSCSYLSGSNALTYIACPTYIYDQKTRDKIQTNLIITRKRTDYLIIYTTNYTVCYQANYKTYESRLFMIGNSNETFDEFLYLIKYFQLYHNENDSSCQQLFDKIHNYMVKCLKELYHPDNTDAISIMPNENLSHVFMIFVKFIRIFRSLNQIHETNLTILSYFIGVSNDFFYHLINYKEIWLAFLFIEICENYLLKSLRLKMSKNKLCEGQMGKSQTSYLLLNPYIQQNPSLKNYNKITNKILHSRMRLLLLFFALVEFRNNQALNINVLYFVLAKLCITKLKKNNLLDDVHLIVKVIIRNWKYLKSENSHSGTEEFVLNGLSMNYRTEILSKFINSRVSRDDIKLDFFKDFLPLETLHDFVELHETYCRGDEEALVNEYNYIYNIGIIQRWILFFSNYFYNLMFEDIKNYISSHIKQTIINKKEIDNISPEEMNLSSLVYFNVVTFMLIINNHIKYFLKFISSKSDNSSESSFIADNSNIVSEFNKLFVPFISPTDIPLMIFEFYSVEDNKNRRNLPYEINLNLNNLILNYMKCFNFSVIDSMDFIDFIGSNGFCVISTRGGHIEKLQKIIFSAFIYYVYVIHKLNQLHFFEFDIELIFSVLNNLHMNVKSQAYEFLFLILNGHLRYLLHLEMSNDMKLSPNNTKYLEVVLNMIKSVFYKIIREEPPYVRRIIHEFIYVTPISAKPYLLEGAMFYEYKNFNKLIKFELFDSLNLLDLKNYNNSEYNNSGVGSDCSNNGNSTGNSKCFTKINIFEELTGETKSKIFDILFLNNYASQTESGSKSFYENFIYGMKNMIHLNKTSISESKIKSTKSGVSYNNFIFYFDNNIETIRKIVINGINEKIKENYNDVLTYELILTMVDKILYGNFENTCSNINNNLKNSNTELKVKLQRSLKLTMLKNMHIFNILYMKFKCFYTLNPHSNILLYLKHLSYFLICGLEKNYRQDTQNAVYIMDYLLNLNLKEIKDTEEDLFIEILRNLHLLFIKLRKNLHIYPKIINLEEKMKLENKHLSMRVNKITSEEIPKIKLIYENLTIKSKNLKTILILLFSDSYWANMMSVQAELNEFFINLNLNKNHNKNRNHEMNPYTALSEAKKRYIEISESFNNLTGIPPKFYIDFTDNWQMINNEELYDFITNDDVKIKEQSEEKQLNTNIILNRRQKLGKDTPRSKHGNILCNNYTLTIEFKENENTQTDSNLNFHKDLLNTSIDLREEPAMKMKITNSLKVKAVGKKNKSNAPKYKMKNEDANDNTSVVTVIKKNTCTENKSLFGGDKLDNDDINEVSLFQGEIEGENNLLSPDITRSNLFVSKIFRVFFNQFKDNVFRKYKEEMSRKELEEIKIYNVRPKDGNVEVIVLKEKYFPNKEIDFNNKPSNSGKNLVNIKEDSIKNTGQTEENNFNFKPFDIINLKKFKSGKADNSSILKDLVKTKNKNTIQSTIKLKLEEIQLKLMKYEEMAMNLGKDFTSSFNK